MKQYNHPKIVVIRRLDRGPQVACCTVFLEDAGLSARARSNELTAKARKEHARISRVFALEIRLTEERAFREAPPADVRDREGSNFAGGVSCDPCPQKGSGTPGLLGSATTERAL